MHNLMRRTVVWLAVVCALLACTVLPLAAQSPLPFAFPTTNLSSTITTGNTFQAISGLGQINPLSVDRKSVTIQNNNSTDSCWVFIGVLGSATKAKSILLGPGGSYQRYTPYVPSDAFNITCTNTADTFYADAQ